MTFDESTDLLKDEIRVERRINSHLQMVDNAQHRAGRHLIMGNIIFIAAVFAGLALLV